jgi:methionine-rich copper-binding protein CopC
MFDPLKTITFIAAALLMAGVQPAWAHATLTASVPEANEMAMPVPTEIRLTFSDSVDPAITKIDISVAGPHHEPIAIKDMAPAANDDNVLIVHLQSGKLPDGLYTVSWKALCIDGHKGSGSFAYDAMQ